MATITRLMTEEEFLALPDDDGVEREVIRGELVERSMTTRNYAHCTVSNRIGFYLTGWLVKQPAPRGSVVTGEARIRLRRDPLTFVGVDVAYVAADSRPDRPREARYIDGPPVLVVEVLSPSDKQQEIEDKVADFLDAGVSIVWIVAPRFSTVTVYRPDAKPQLFNADQELSGEPFLPGFRVAVADLFEDLEA